MQPIQLKNLLSSYYGQSTKLGSVEKIQRLFTISLRRAMNVSENTGQTMIMDIKSACRKDRR